MRERAQGRGCMGVGRGGREREGSEGWLASGQLLDDTRRGIMREDGSEERARKRRGGRVVQRGGYRSMIAALEY